MDETVETDEPVTITVEQSEDEGEGTEVETDGLFDEVIDEREDTDGLFDEVAGEDDIEESEGTVFLAVQGVVTDVRGDSELYTFTVTGEDDPATYEVYVPKNDPDTVWCPCSREDCGHAGAASDLLQDAAGLTARGTPNATHIRALIDG